MKKFLILSLLFLPVMLFGQDGHTTVNFYNQTSGSVNFSIDGNPACPGAVIPNGSCSEYVNPGNHVLRATNGEQSVARDISLSYGETFNWTVGEDDSSSVVPSKSTARYVPASLRAYDGFTVDAPVTLVTSGPEQSTTNEGKPFTQTIYKGVLPNNDVYMVAVGVYPFAVTNEDLDRDLKGFTGALPEGKVVSQKNLTVSGQPALVAVVSSKDSKGRESRYGLLVTFKGNKGYQFLFGSYVDVASDEEAITRFFTSIEIK